MRNRTAKWLVGLAIVTAGLILMGGDKSSSAPKASEVKPVVQNLAQAQGKWWDCK